MVSLLKMKIKKPTWQRDNSVEKLVCHGLKESEAIIRKKENNEVKKILVKNGWKYAESINILYEGYTLSFRKQVGSQTHPFLCFDWYWDNDGGPEYFVAKLRGFCSLYSDRTVSNPYAHVEISRIYRMHLKDMIQLEKNILNALKSLKSIKP